MPSGTKPILMRGLEVAVLDNRSAVDSVPIGSFRHKLNWSVTPDMKLARAKGWQRFYKSDSVTNHDLHEAAAEGEPATLLFSSVSNEGMRRLFSATKTKIKVLDEDAGTWTTLGSGFGADGNPSLTQVRFHAAELQNRVLFTNNLDLVQIHTLGSSSVGPIAALALVDNELEPNAQGLTKAKVIVQHSGFIFLMNTTEGGVNIKSRIRWCHLNSPESWVVGEAVTLPEGGAGTSVADYQDLPYSEEILAALPMAGFLWIFTNQSIWRCSVTVDLGTDTVPGTVGLNAVKVYSDPKTQSRCLAYPNAIVSTGASFLYAGRDAIYQFDQYLNEPERVEWIHRATGIVYKDISSRIDKTACESPIMEFRSATNDDDTAGGGEVHFSWPTIASESDINSKTLVINTRAKTCDERDYGSTAMVNFRKNSPGECNQEVALVASSGSDLTLKEMDTGSVREMYDATEDEYTEVGYYSVLRGIFPFERFESEKEIHSFAIQHEPENPTDAAVFRLRLATADGALDPNVANGRCEVLWRQLRNQTMKCRYAFTASQYLANGVKPRSPVVWNYFLSGRYLYYELTIADASGLAPVGGICSISHFQVDAGMK